MPSVARTLALDHRSTVRPHSSSTSATSCDTLVSLPPGSERNQHQQVVASRAVQEREMARRTHGGSLRRQRLIDATALALLRIHLASQGRGRSGTISCGGRSLFG